MVGATSSESFLVRVSVGSITQNVADEILRAVQAVRQQTWVRVCR